MTSFRARALFSVLSAVSFLLSVYLSWILSPNIAGDSPSASAAASAAVSALNLAIISGWIGLGVIGGAAITVFAVLLVLLLGVKTGYYGLNIFIPVFFVSAWAGRFFTSSGIHRDRIHLLGLERIEEEINLLTNEIKEKNKGIKAFEEKLMKYSSLREVSESLSAILSLDGVTGTIVEKASRTIGKPGRMLLFLVDQEKQDLMLSASSARSYPVIKTKKGDLFDRWVLRHRKPLMVEDVTKDFRFPAEGADEAVDVFRSMIASPLVSEGRVIGILRMDSMREFAYTQDDLRLLDIIANLGAVAVQNSVLYLKTQELAIRDSLTGLKVRRFFMESFHREVRRSTRKRENLSLLLMDIDHFKEYNDKYGHASGDLILKHIAGIINDVLEDADVAGRYGGEEIAVLLWRKGKKDSAQKAEKLRRMIKNRPLKVKGVETSITVSIGVSTFPSDGVTEEELVRVADTRLYKAKAEGRDMVCSD